MRKFFLIISLFIFTPVFFFAAEFQDIAFEQLYNRRVKDSFREAMEFWSEDFDEESTGKILEEEYNQMHAVARDFFESLPEDYIVVPYLDYYFDEDDEIQFHYMLNVETDDFTFDMFNFSLDKDGLHGAVELTNETEEGNLELFFDDFYILNDGSLKSGYTNEEYGGSYDFSDGKTHFWIYDAYLEKSGDSYNVVSLAPSIFSDVFYDSEEITLGKTIFDSNCNILSSEEFNKHQVQDPDELEYGPYRIEIDSIKWDAEKKTFLANGRLDVDALDIHLELKNYEFILEGRHCSFNTEDEFTFSYNGYPITAKGLTVKNNYIIADSAYIHFGDSKTPPYSELDFAGSWNGKEATWTLNGRYRYNKELELKTRILCDDDILNNVYFDSNGLILEFKSKFPTGNDYADTHTLKFKPDGSFEIEDEIYSKLKLGLKDSILDGEYVGYIPERKKFSVPYSSLIFPESTNLGPIALKRLYLGSDGLIEKDDYSAITAPTTFCSRTFSPNKFSFTEEGVILSGTLYTPENFPGNLSSSRLSIEKLYVGYDGRIKEFISPQERSYNFYLPGQGYIAMLSKSSHLELEQKEDDDGYLTPAVCRLYLDDCRLLLPGPYHVYGDINVDGVRFSLRKKGEPDYDRFVINGGFYIMLNGMHYDVNEGKIKSISDYEGTKRYVEFTGDLKLSEQEKAPFVMDIDFDGKLQRLQIEQNGKQVELKTLNRIFRLL